MRTISIFIASCVLAAIVPLLSIGHDFGISPMTFPGWPTHVEGYLLRELPLSEREKRFDTGFPGRIAKFTDGTREFVIRWVTQETRKLHPSSDCFKGLSYFIQPMPVRVDTNQNRWGCFEAIRGTEKFHVCERIYDGAGNTWTDVSTWYWAAFLGKTHGPWWAITVAENQLTINNEQ
ncbi:MAG: hypothetical protein L0Y56_22640 [Nitrospira sp.]|nr:hypothetical protein [Nitrospira sp.]